MYTVTDLIDVLKTFDIENAKFGVHDIPVSHPNVMALVQIPPQAAAIYVGNGPSQEVFWLLAKMG